MCCCSGIHDDVAVLVCDKENVDDVSPCLNEDEGTAWTCRMHSLVNIGSNAYWMQYKYLVFAKLDVFGINLTDQYKKITVSVCHLLLVPKSCISCSM